MAVVPAEPVEQQGSDALRSWLAASYYNPMGHFYGDLDVDVFLDGAVETVGIESIIESWTPLAANPCTKILRPL